MPQISADWSATLLGASSSPSSKPCAPRFILYYNEVYTTVQNNDRAHSLHTMLAPSDHHSAQARYAWSGTCSQWLMQTPSYVVLDCDLGRGSPTPKSLVLLHSGAQVFHSGTKVLLHLAHLAPRVRNALLWKHRLASQEEANIRLKFDRVKGALEALDRLAVTGDQKLFIILGTWTCVEVGNSQQHA